MQVKPCKTYHARLVERSRVEMADGRSVFKVYFLDIIGRVDRTRYEWEASALKPAELLERFRQAAPEGVGFVTAFPHIIKLFRFAPEMETVMQVRAFNAGDLTPLDLMRADGYCEFACYAEALLAAAEYRAWASAGNVEEYLDFMAGLEDGPILAHDKLRLYARRKEAARLPPNS